MRFAVSEIPRFFYGKFLSITKGAWGMSQHFRATSAGPLDRQSQLATFQDIIANAKEMIEEITVNQAECWLIRERKPIAVVDVREPDEYAAGCLPGAIFIPRGFLELRIEEAVKRDEPVLVYCASGTRSALAAKTLLDMGHTQVWSLAGGYNRWSDSGYPIERPAMLSREQKERYRRHLALPEIGEQGQVRLLDSKVLVLGAGGLGSPAAMYLAAAGVGTIGIVDDDVVDLSNLQRQIIHRQTTIGKPKVDSARQTIEGLNPDVKVVPFATRITAANALEIISGFDVVVDGSDNFSTRYLLNDACVQLNKPYVHGSIYRFEGHVATFVPHQTPCYRCLFPHAPDADIAPSCAEAGVLGVLPGLIGVLQAAEAIKLLLGKGTLLGGRLLTYHALETRFHELRFQRDAACVACGESPRIELADMPVHCSIAA